jgi:prophage DNA circulation protein
MSEVTKLPNGVPSGSTLDAQPATGFGEYTFPCSYHKLLGEQRDHIHEYPHRDAGAPEKLGRKLYTVQVRGLFYSNLEQFPSLYPFIIDNLQRMFEAGTTATLIHPSVGSIPAYIKRWDRERNPKDRAGEFVDITFQEDQQEQFLQGDISQLARNATLEAGVQELAQQLKAVQAQNTLLLSRPTLTLFAGVQTLANEITGIADTAQMYGNLVQAKAQQLCNICNQLDTALELQEARAYELVEALHNLWAQGNLLVIDTQAKRTQTQTYTVETSMPMTAISARLYNGDASHADDLFALNATIIPDKMRVRAGIKISYYPTN